MSVNLTGKRCRFKHPPPHQKKENHAYYVQKKMYKLKKYGPTTLT